jgi:hypothetical protein
MSLSIAIFCANCTARGQYGQVGVTKTWRWRGSFSPARASLVFVARPDSPAEIDLMASMSEENS